MFLGFVIFLGMNAIHFRAKKEPMVTLSTTEAEYIAMSLAVQETEWIRNFLYELGIETKVPNVFCDNMGAVKIAKNLTANGRTKHLDIRMQFIKEKVENGAIIVKHIRSCDNIADIFTKALSRKTFEHLRESVDTKDKRSKVYNEESTTKGKVDKLYEKESSMKGI